MRYAILLLVFFATVTRTEFLPGERFTIDSYILDGEPSLITIEAPAGFDALGPQSAAGTHVGFSYQVRADATPGLYTFHISSGGQSSVVVVRVQPVIAPPAQQKPIYVPAFYH